MIGGPETVDPADERAALRARVAELETALMELSQRRDEDEIAFDAERVQMRRVADNAEQKARRDVRYRLGAMLVETFHPPRVLPILTSPWRIARFWIRESRR